MSSAAAVNLLAWPVDYLPIVKFKSRCHGVILLMVQKSGDHQLRLVVNILLFSRFYTSQVVVWNFFHQQYHLLSNHTFLLDSISLQTHKLLIDGRYMIELFSPFINHCVTDDCVMTDLVSSSLPSGQSVAFPAMIWPLRLLEHLRLTVQ